jgi:PAS domain S-box-containing protein
LPTTRFAPLAAIDARYVARLVLELLVVGVAYFLLAKGAQALTALQGSAVPIWPPTGLAFAAVLLRGLRVWPAIFLAAIAANVTEIANATVADAVLTASAIAAGYTLEALIGGYLVHVWSGGTTFDSPAGVAKFALIALGATAIGAAIGVASLALAGHADWASFVPMWLAWWLGNAAGALVITPVLVLWAAHDPRTFHRDDILEAAAVFLLTGALGVFAFSPLVEPFPYRASVAFLTALPLAWAALRCGRRVTATVALVVAGFAMWGAAAASGAFARATLDDSFLLLIMFMLAASVPGLALSAEVDLRRSAEAASRRQEQDLRSVASQLAEEVTARREAQERLQQAHDDLETRLSRRTAALEEANRVLETESERRTRVEAALKADIAERRKAQAAQTESERRFRLFIEAVTDYAIFMLDPDGNISNWNTGAERIHQYTAAEITGAHFSHFYTEEDQQRGEPARALKVAAYEGKHVAEGWRRRRDGTLFWANVVIEAIHDEVGSLVGFAQITRDISERREAEAALERAKEQLTQSQKMEALGQLTGSIAHDFNNLLMIVSGHAQLLRRRLTDPKQLQAIDAVHTAASRGESLTRQLLAFSRRQPLSPVVVDLRERVTAVHEMLIGSLRGNIALKWDIPADVWPVEIDIAEFELALVNVAVNARDAMPGGGTITLSARNVTLTQKDKLDELEGDFIALALSDTGVGIAPDVLPRIFEPFFTTKGLGKGTGLGLSQVYGFARQSGGSVIATSTAGSGTTLTIYLPRSHAAPARAAEAEMHAAVPAEGTVLVVEDNAEVAEVTASLVEQLGYRTVRSENAADALNRLQRGERVALVLSDIVMPGAMNGIALAQVIARRYPHIPILLASGYSDMVQAAESRFVVLRKPFQLSVLEQAVRDALERSSARNQGARVLPFARSEGTSG